MIKKFENFINEEISNPTKPSYASYSSIAKKLMDFNKNDIKEFLLLYEKYKDKEILDIITSNNNLSNSLKNVRNKLFIDVKGKFNELKAYRFIQVIHMILCGITFDCDEREEKALKKVWFYGAGMTRKIDFLGK